MRNLIILAFLPVFAFAQREVQVSEDYTTILIFPSEIDMNILGNQQEYTIKETPKNSNISKYTVTINYTKIDNVEKNTNLTVFTRDGNSYSFLLRYAKKPNKLDPYYISLKESSNSAWKSNPESSEATVRVKDSYYSQGVTTIEKNESSTQDTNEEISLYQSDKLAYIEGYCRAYNNTPKRIFRTYDSNSNVKLTLKDISYDNDELYFHFMISNEGVQSFDVDFINSKLSRDYKGVSTDQSIPLTPLFIFNRPEKVVGKSDVEFTMVFKKFTINDKKEFQIDLAEKQGERDLLLRIDNKLINSPSKL